MLNPTVTSPTLNWLSNRLPSLMRLTSWGPPLVGARMVRTPWSLEYSFCFFRKGRKDGQPLGASTIATMPVQGQVFSANLNAAMQVDCSDVGPEVLKYWLKFWGSTGTRSICWSKGSFLLQFGVWRCCRLWTYLLESCWRPCKAGNSKVSEDMHSTSLMKPHIHSQIGVLKH